MYRRGEDVHNDVASIFVGSAVFGDAFALGAKACDLGASFRMHAGLVVNEQIDGWAMLAAVFAHAPFALPCPRATPRVCLPGIKVLGSSCAPRSVASLAGTSCVCACVRACVWVGGLCQHCVSVSLWPCVFGHVCTYIVFVGERVFKKRVVRRRSSLATVATKL
jgi:hypothetical protein